MAHPPNLLPLKVLVISLGLVLIGGTIFVFAAIAGKAGKDMRESHCPDASFSLEGKGQLAGIMPQGDIVQIVLATGNENKVLTIDRCTGKTLHTFTIKP